MTISFLLNYLKKVAKLMQVNALGQPTAVLPTSMY